MLSNSVVVVAAAISCLLIAMSANADKVVFVYGLGGFGPTELFGLNYWGFTKIFPNQNYLDIFENRGHDVLYAVIGPVSSNWDRACELYAQIKGVKTDYGLNHSTTFGHARYGPDYTGQGFFPDWDGSPENRIHFISHSMGGATMRVLEKLLQQGSAAEVAATGAETSELFQLNKTNGNTWIQSISSVSGTLDGSTLETVLGGSIVNVIKSLIAGFASILGLLTINTDWLYNFQLNQFGLQREPGESFSSYYSRVFESPIWDSGFKDLASYDLSPEAMTILNSEMELTYPDTYYFSFSTYQTYACFPNVQCPTVSIEIFLALTAGLLGDINGKCDEFGFCFTDAWEANDGLVPIQSSQSPSLGVVNYVPPTPMGSVSTFQKAVWYNAEVQSDHVQIIGFHLNPLGPWNAGEQVFTRIANNIELIPVMGSANEVLSGPIIAQESGTNSGVSTAGAIGGSIVGVAAVAGLVAFVVVRRRRSSSDMSNASLSPRFSAQVMSRGSIALQEVSAVNPGFGMVDLGGDKA